MKYYVYRHIRLDKNIPFYIGISKTQDSDNFYKKYNRAFNKYQRSKLWTSIINKSDYRVEIIYESDVFEEIKQKEIEFIELYGRVDLKTGSLANHTKGGDGTTGYELSEETREKIATHSKNRVRKKGYKQNLSLEGRERKIKALKNKIVTEETKNKISKSRIGNSFAKGHVLTEEVKNNIRNKMSCKAILQYDLNNNFIQEYPSAHYINKHFKHLFDRSGIRRCCKGTLESYKGFIWKFKNE
jgi:hypothetical protein